jgi:16S rRNA (cytosine1402-N4)-methyltransferase
MSQTPAHIPVMLAEVLAALAPKDGGRYLDGTFGAGGYTRAILEAANCVVVAIDRDPDAIARGAPLRAKFGARLTLVEAPFGSLETATNARDFDGLALDLGVSSPQLDDPARGFSFRADGPLDMRMAKSGLSAADIVNEWPEGDLADLLYELGEERFSRRIAKAIVARRAEKRIERTLELAEIVRACVPRSKDGIDPAKRSFQALRLAANDELGELARGLEAAERVLAPGGRLAVVTFHSLEDRAVKNFLKRRAGSDDQGSRHLPAKARAQAPSFALVARKGQRASEAEIARNPRARSATLRVAERTQAPAWSAAA